MVDPDGICFHTLRRGGPGETALTRGEADLIPGLPGMAPRLWEVERRIIEFTGWVRGVATDEESDREDYWDNRITLAGWLPPTEIIEIVITLPGGAQYSISARPMPIPAYREEAPSYAENSLEFESFDPDWVAEGS